MIVASAQSSVFALTLFSALAYLSAAFLTHARDRVGRSGAFLLSSAAVSHAVVLWLGLTQPPRFGFGPALSMTAWMALAVYGIESFRYRLRQLRWRLALTGAVTVVLAWVFPGVELLESQRTWLPLHLAVGMSSYGLFTVAVLHAWLMSQAERRMRSGGLALETDSESSSLPLMTLERLTFRFVAFGFVLLTATIVLAGFGEVGGGWHWSHKTVFSMLSWLVFAVLLWGHSYRGWRGQRTVRAIYVGAALLLLGYAGSHFVLEVLLHRTV